MRILIITDTFPPEKVGSYRMHDLAINLAKQGDKVTVLCPPPTFPFGSFKRVWNPCTIRFEDGVKIVHLWTWQPQSASVSSLSRVAYYLFMPIISSCWTNLNQDFDVILTSSGSNPFIWLPGLILKKFSKPWIMDVRDLLVDGAISLGFLKQDGLITNLLKKLENVCYLKSNYIIVTTKAALQSIESLGVSSQKIKLIINAADLSTFKPECTTKKRQIIYAGNIGHAQDFDCILAAMKELCATNVQLLIIGEGELKRKLRATVRLQDLSKNVLVLDGIDRKKLPALLSESMVGIAPLKKINTIEESIPAKIFDYMACAIPFVAFGGSDLKKIAQITGAGIVIDNNPKDFANTIISLVNDSEKCQRMGYLGREYCEKYYNRQVMAQEIKGLINEIA